MKKKGVSPWKWKGRRKNSRDNGNKMKNETIGVVIRDQQAKTTGRPVFLTAQLSNCCHAPMRVEGDLTQYHVCTKCDHACDPEIPHEQT